MSERDLIVTPAGTTPGGLPYPEDNDAVMLGAQAIRALALAIEAQPWWAFVRWTQGTLGTGADAGMQAWDLQEANFTIGEPSTGGGGIIAPKAGLYEVRATVEYSAAPWPASGQILMSVGIKSSAVPPREVFVQRSEVNGGSNRRSYHVSALLRLAAGERCSAFMNNGTGSGVTHSGSVPPGDRHASRFSGRWVAP